VGGSRVILGAYACAGISGRAFVGSTGMYLGVYNDLQVSSESAGVGTSVHKDQTDIGAREYQGKEAYEIHGARFETAMWSHLATQLVDRQLGNCVMMLP